MADKVMLPADPMTAVTAAMQAASQGRKGVAQHNSAPTSAVVATPPAKPRLTWMR